MPEFSRDWSHTRSHWADLFDSLGLRGRPVEVLEIGCFEGQGTLEFLRLLDCHVTVVDPFILAGQWAAFEENTRLFLEQVRVFAGPSQEVLRTHRSSYDLVYVDGSHFARDVLTDAVLAWPLVKPGGAMLFDDYLGLPGGILDTPKVAVDAFAFCFDGEIADSRIVGEDQFVVVRDA